jgi:ribulose kinase
MITQDGKQEIRVTVIDEDQDKILEPMFIDMFFPDTKPESEVEQSINEYINIVYDSIPYIVKEVIEEEVIGG